MPVSSLGFLCASCTPWTGSWKGPQHRNNPRPRPHRSRQEKLSLSCRRTRKQAALQNSNLCDSKHFSRKTPVGGNCRSPNSNQRRHSGKLRPLPLPGNTEAPRPVPTGVIAKGPKGSLDFLPPPGREEEGAVPLSTQ